MTAAEHLYVCIFYGPIAGLKDDVEGLLLSLGAKKMGALWVYTNEALGKTFAVHFVSDMQGLKQALGTDGAHIVACGHANYGLGPAFASSREQARQRITAIRTIDDDRFFACSSPWIAVKVCGMVEKQEYPHWQPVYKDGTSGILPYDFGDSKGDPPYNYYITYQVPGDPTHYRVETVANSALMRSPGCGRPAWYSPDGSLPDPENPEHRQFYITNRDETFLLTGAWQTSGESDETHDDDYLYTAAGKGDRSATWRFEIPLAGRYKVEAWWLDSSKNAMRVPFTVSYAAGSSTVWADQKRTGNCWNVLGEFPFEAAQYTVTVTNNAARGNVIADAIRITDATGATAFELIAENGTAPKSHYMNKTIVARRDLTVQPKQMRYARLFLDTCNSGLYFLETLHRGVTFYTVENSHVGGMLPYLGAYLQGKSDAEIWAILQGVEPVYDYYDFSKPPPTLEAGAVVAGVSTKTSAARPGGSAPAPEPSPQVQAAIEALSSVPTSTLLGRLKAPEFLADPGLLRRGVARAYRDRQAEGLASALDILKAIARQAAGEETASGVQDWAVAKAILEAFPSASVPRLLKLYDGSDYATKGTVIRALGNLDDGGSVDAVLLAALEDKTPCETEAPESEGTPLRLCDVAYNQLVLRYELDGVLRVLGSLHRTAVRDYHIAALLSRIDVTP